MRRAPRCYLFVPADKPAMLEKAAHRGADALILDLEDAIAPVSRSAAFASAADWLARGDRGDCEVWVRIPHDASVAEIEAIMWSSPDGLVLPKQSSPDQVADVVGTAGECPLVVIIETARGLMAAPAMAEIPQVVRLMSGEIDLAAELGLDMSSDLAMASVRSQVVLASAAAGLPGPMASVTPDFTDLVSLEQRARVQLAQGFRAGVAIHPAQIETYRDVYQPSEVDLARARRLVEIYDSALAQGKGAVTDDDGHMMDEATVRAARELIER